MAPRLKTEKRTIQHVRDGGERVPVGGVHMGERPLSSIKRETVCDHWVFTNVMIVVLIDEVVLKGLAEDDPDKCHEKNRDDCGDNRVTRPVISAYCRGCLLGHHGLRLAPQVTLPFCHP